VNTPAVKVQDYMIQADMQQLKQQTATVLEEQRWMS
jgi:hypothetical protein